VTKARVAAKDSQEKLERARGIRGGTIEGRTGRSTCQLYLSVVLGRGEAGPQSQSRSPGKMNTIDRRTLSSPKCQRRRELAVFQEGEQIKDGREEGSG